MFHLLKTEGPCSECRYISDYLLKISFFDSKDGVPSTYFTYLCRKCVLSILNEESVPWGISDKELSEMIDKWSKFRDDGLGCVDVVDDSMAVFPPGNTNIEDLSDDDFLKLFITDDAFLDLLGIESDNPVNDFEINRIRDKYSYKHLDYMLSKINATQLEMWIWDIEAEAYNLGFVLSYIISTALFFIIYVVVTQRW